MILPLYRGHNAPKRPNSRTNHGLWYDKFCHVWPANNSWSLRAQRNSNPKEEWINSVTSGKIGDSGRIRDMYERLLKMVTGLNGSLRPFKTQWHFVTGLGRNHPVENGFAWHYTIGTPYLPGSSVKGIIRSWAKKWQKEENTVINRIFGPDNQHDKNVGSVIFFDALPADQVQLAADVMTPHYSEYYRNNGENQVPPADWLSPDPIQFLTVAPGQTFIFAVAPRRPDVETDQADSRKVLHWLEEALTWTGAGAKTGTGYGRFLIDAEHDKLLKQNTQKIQREEQLHKLKEEEKKQAERRQQAFAAMSPIRREMEQDGYSNDPEMFMSLLTTKWLDRMDGKGVEPEDSREIAQLLAEWYKSNKAKQWKKPKGKNEVKVKRIKAILE